MFKRFIIVLSAVAAVCSAPSPTPVTRTIDDLRALNRSIDAIRSSPVLLSPDTALVDEFFLSSIRENPAIRVMTRIGPDGTILNLVNSRGVGQPAATVAGDRWFTGLSAARRPYTGTSRDETGRVLLFRAWPIIETSDSIDRLAGAVTVKIDFRKYFAAVQENETTPVTVLFKGTVVYSRTRDDTINYEETSLPLSGSDSLVVRFGKNSSPQTALPAEAATKPPASVSGSSTVSKEGLQKTAAAETQESGRANSLKSAPTNDTGLLDRSAHENRPFFKIAMIAGIWALIIIVMVVVLIKRSQRRPSGETRLGRVPRSEHDTATTEPGASQFMTEADTLEECLSIEKETRMLPVIQELIAETSKKLHDCDPAADSSERDRIFHKIRDDLKNWVRSEFQHLAVRLNQVVDTIKECETRDGSSAELQELRSEIGRILEEIAKLEKRLPQEIVTPDR